MYCATSVNSSIDKINNERRLERRGDFNQWKIGLFEQESKRTGEDKDSFPFLVTRFPLLFSVVTSLSFPASRVILSLSVEDRRVPSLGPDGILIQFCLRKAGGPSFLPSAKTLIAIFN